MFRLKLSYLEYILFVLLGASSTMSIVGWIIGGRFLSLFSIFLAASVLFLILCPKIKFTVESKSDIHFYIWMLVSLLSCVFGYLYFSGMSRWQEASVSGISKIFLYSIILFLLCRSKRRLRYVRYIAKGLLLGIIINVVWCIVDAVIFYSLGYSITNQLFSSYIEAKEIRYGMVSLITSGGGQIRCSGLNYDPANIGIFTPILTMYSLKSQKKILLVLSFLSVFASVSILALVGIVLIFAVHLLSYKKFTKSLITIFISIGILFVLVSTNSKLSERMSKAVSNRIEMKEDVSGLGDTNRNVYFAEFFPMILENPMYLIIGTGFNTASYAYKETEYLKNSSLWPYDPECTYISFFFDCGLIGFSFFVLLLCTLYKKFNMLMHLNINYITLLYSAIVGTIIAFWGYHYTLYSVAMLIIICAIAVNTKDYHLVHCGNNKD